MIESYSIGRMKVNGKQYSADIIVSGDLEYGLTRMYEMMVEDETTSEINVFRDRETAENWLLLEE